MFFNPFVIPGTSGSAAVVSLSTAVFSAASPATTFVYTNLSIGAATADRYIIAGITGLGVNAGTALSMVINSITATRAVSVANPNSDASLWIALVTAGTTATFTAVFSTEKGRATLGVWIATGLVTSVPTNVYTTTTPSGNTLSVSANISAGGFGVGITGSNSNTATVTWAGLTEDYELTPNNTPNSGASQNFGSAQSGLTVSATYGTTTVQPVFVVAAFR